VVDEHQHCPCNGILLCRTCHNWVHAHPKDAKAQGLIVGRHVEQPTMVPVIVDDWWWVMHCSGEATHVPTGRIAFNGVTPSVIEH